MLLTPKYDIVIGIRFSERCLKVENKNGLFDLIFGFYGLCQLFTIFILFDWLLLKLVQLGFKVKTK